jgi:precorrin-4/cobalt-precorrin-4 C11-methyltransferase
MSRFKRSVFFLMAITCGFCGALIFTPLDLRASAQAEPVKSPGAFYVIGMGPGPADLVTMRAINHLKKCDVIICTKEAAVRYKMYLQGKELLHLPLFPYYEALQKQCAEPSQADKQRCEELIAMRKDRALRIRKLNAEGRSVALLEGGDPCIFGSLRWIKQEFSDTEFEVISGISCFNVANALLKREVADAYVADWQTRSVILTTPTRERDRMDAVANLSTHRATMVFFMPREFEEKILPKLKKHYPSDTPVAIVYKAGFPEEQMVIKSTLGDFPVQEPEKRWSRLIYIGEFLKDAAQNK